MVKVYVEAYGCSQNIAETFMLARSIGEHVENAEKADIILIGTCVVIEHTEHRMLRRIKKLQKYGKKIVVYGCLPSARRELLKDDIIPITTWEFENAHKILGVDKSPLDEVFIWDSIATIPIANGCLGSCTYCITKVARGRIKSRREDWIVNMAKNVLNRGAVEIRISAQDTAAYGVDIESDLPTLIKKLVSLKGRYLLRVGMMEPRETLKILNPLLEAYASSKVYKFLHLPVQSGDNEILKKMNRGYTVDDFEKIVFRFRERFPEMTLSTDIIVGFPGENDETFENTMKLMEKIKPDILNITRFSPRPKTLAYRWKRPSTNKVKEWSQKITELHLENMRRRMEKMVGKEFNVVVPSHGKRGNYLARTINYVPVVLKKAKTGKFYRVHITDFSGAHLNGEILEEKEFL
ncbi:MAG: tRNA (N(6)-L-threonylcarbamoyladenosine(37)-C(2))-methylthiotransferase [Thermoplasmata archaeon]|nr:tRNA (N(6)-L-threonylcarbamoyladenosine(37)-C(2))-methylthiotransferase [Thermoplasmata archaeon]